MKYRVLKISNNLSEYPECKKDTNEFPHLVDLVDDEMDFFVVDQAGEYCKADEFFLINDIQEFET